MDMLVMFIMDVFMAVLDGLMSVPMNMVFCQVQPDADRHQYPGQN